VHVERVAHVVALERVRRTTEAEHVGLEVRARAEREARDHDADEAEHAVEREARAEEAARLPFEAVRRVVADEATGAAHLVP
jgi:hypothetical protein